MAATLATLTAALSQLGQKDQAFAQDLVRAWNRYGRLTDKQAYWADKLVERANTPPAPRETVDVGNFSAMTALFDKAATHLKSPSFSLLDETVGEIRITLAGQRSANPGTINVATPGGYGSNRWFGRIRRDGQFEKSPRNASPISLIALLTRFAAEPAKVAAEYGKLRGECCFCGIRLSDERSTAAGYGKTCARNWGLPYPTLTEARAQLAKLAA